MLLLFCQKMTDSKNIIFDATIPFHQCLTEKAYFLFTFKVKVLLFCSSWEAIPVGPQKWVSLEGNPSEDLRRQE